MLFKYKKGSQKNPLASNCCFIASQRSRGQTSWKEWAPGEFGRVTSSLNLLGCWQRLKDTVEDSEPWKRRLTTQLIICWKKCIMRTLIKVGANSVWKKPEHPWKFFKDACYCEGRRQHGESLLFLLDREIGSVTLFPSNPVSMGSKSPCLPIPVYNYCIIVRMENSKSLIC